MAKRTFLAGATSQTDDVFIPDSSKTDGSGLSGLAYNTSGLKAYYRLGATGSATAITLATQTVGGAFSSGGFVEIDATNMKGQYRFDIPNAVFASGGVTVTIYFYGATNVAPTIVQYEVVAYNPYDAVRLGLTALPNANAEAAGGLYTRGTGAGQIKQDANGRIDSNLVAILGTTLTETAGQIAAAFKKLFNVATPTAQTDNLPLNTDYTSARATKLDNLDATVSSRGTSNLTQTQVTGGAYSVQSASCVLGDARIAHLDADVSSRMATFTLPTNFSALLIGAGGHISNVDTLTTYTGNTPQTGDAFARLGAPAGASVSADVAAVKAETDTILTDVNAGGGAIYNRLGAPAGASISADVAAVKSDTASIISTLAGQVAAIWTAFNATQLAKFFSVATGSLFAAAVSQSVVKETALGASGGGVAIPLVIGGWTKSGSTYYVNYALVINGAIVTSGLSALSVTFRDKDGSDLVFSGSPSATASGIVKANGSLATPVTANTPVSVVVAVTYNSVAYSAVLPGAQIA